MRTGEPRPGTLPCQRRAALRPLAFGWSNGYPFVMPPKHTPIAGPSRCEAISGIMIGHFVTRLQVEAKRAGGSLTAAEIQRFGETFLTQETARFAAVFQRSFDQCGKARELTALEQSRRNPFDRLLMKKFSHLFPARMGDDGTEDCRKAVLSRRVIPGFNLAVNKMIGPVLYEQCQRKCQGVVERAGDWEAIYADREVQALVGDVLVVVAHYFADFEKRRRWFATIVNNHLAPPDAGEVEDGWRLTDFAFHQLMHALFDDMRREMDGNPKPFRTRFGAHTVGTLAEFFRQLDLHPAL